MLPAGIRFEIDRLRLENTRGKASYSCDAISTALSRTQARTEFELPYRAWGSQL